jgi:tetratricopeptide (TPR) repeat protein
MGGAIAVGGPLSLALLLLVAALALLITLMPQIAGRVRGYQMLRGDIQRLEEDLRRQPDVPFPHLKLGEIYYEQEDWDRAIEHYQAYIEAQELSGDAKRRLERCVERKRIRDLGLRRCPVCGAENKRTNARCVECGFYLKGMVEVLDTLVTPEMMVIWKWLAIVFLLPAVAVGVFAQVIPPTLTMAMLACSIIATVIFLYGRMRAEGGRRF